MNPKTKECVEVLKLYLEMADSFYNLQEKSGVKFTKGRLKFRKDIKEAVSYALTTLPKYEEALRKIAEHNIYTIPQIEIRNIAKNVLEGDR